MDRDTPRARRASQRAGLGTLASWGIDAATARDLHAFEVQRGISRMGAGPTEADFTAFKERFAGRLTAEQIDALVEWRRLW